MSIADLSPLDRLLAAWAALEVTIATDELSGIERKDARDSCLYVAILASRELDPHPIDKLLSRERETMHRLYRPREGQWWNDPDRTYEARMTNGIVKALEMVRKGWPPRQISEEVKICLREIPVHYQDQAQFRVLHLCRLAGLEPPND